MAAIKTNAYTLLLICLFICFSYLNEDLIWYQILGPNLFSFVTLEIIFFGPLATRITVEKFAICFLLMTVVSGPVLGEGLKGYVHLSSLFS